MLVAEKIRTLAQSAALVFVVVAGCAEATDPTADSASQPETNADTVACGVEVDPEIPCCPKSRHRGDPCDESRDHLRCWSACDGVITSADGPQTVRAQLSCQPNGDSHSSTKSIIASGLGLFPCTPGPSDPQRERDF